MTTTRHLCPLCDWHHDVGMTQVRPGPDLVVTAELSADDARGDLVYAMARTIVEHTETVVRAHLETHTLIEWVTALQAAKQQLVDEKARQEAYEESVVGALNERNISDCRRADKAEAAIGRVRAILDPSSWARDLDIIEALEQP